MASCFGVVTLAVAGAIFAAGCTVGYEPQPVYARAVYYPPPPRPAYHQPAPYYPSSPPQQAGPPPGAPQTAPPQQAASPPEPGPGDCIDPGPRDIPDHFSQAAALEAQSQTIGCLTVRDVDLFVVTGPPGKTGHIIRFTLRGQKKMTPVVTLYDADRNEIAEVRGPASGEARGWLVLAEGTPVYMKVQAHWPLEDVYTLTLTNEPISDHGEPNDDMDHATPLHEGAPISAFLGNLMNAPAAAIDWYRFEMKHEGPITFDVDMSEGVVPQLTVFDSDRRELGGATGQAGAKLHHTIKLRRGAYFVRLKPYYATAIAGNGDGPLRLKQPYTLDAR